MKIDPPTFLLCCLGALGFYLLWFHGILTADLIWKILAADI